jgi:hypothetical protein
MSSSASNEVYNMLIKLWGKLTRLNGVITPEAVIKLEDKLGRIFTVAKTHHYTQGQKYGHLASTIPESKYRLIIGNATWTHTVPTNPGAYSTDALNAGNAAATRKQLVAQHKIKQKSYRDYLNVEEAGKELILYKVGDNAVAPLKKQYIGLGNTTVLAMIDHLCLKMVIRMTTAHKYEYKMNGYNTPWDPTMSIRAYFSLLDCFQVSLQLQDWDKQQREDNGSRSADVAIGNDHRGPNDCLGEQGCDGANVGGTPDILYREVAEVEAILSNNSKTIAIQGGSATCTRDSSSRRGR